MLAGTVAMLAACEGIPNPTGSCEGGDGSRVGYHVSDDTWLPDCQNTLRREYWRVFARSASSAYTIPRMDGEPRLQPACADAGHPLGLLVVSYGLCASATNETEVARVNDMLPVDALTLTHFLHQQLSFTPDDAAGVGIDPFPMPSDVLDACAMYGGSSSAELTALCASERQRVSSGLDIGYRYSGVAAVELADRLNALYGIAPL